MTRIISVISLYCCFMTGCLPSAGFSPVMLPDGRSGFHASTQNMTKEMSMIYISEGIGTYKICPNGWDVTSEEQSDYGYTIYKGLCKSVKK